jgi:hypothetical protein
MMALAMNRGAIKMIESRDQNSDKVSKADFKTWIRLLPLVKIWYSPRFCNRLELVDSVE